MSLALRPYVTAGVAVVGASVIAVSPTVALPMYVQHLDVQLSAAARNLSPRPVVEQFFRTAAVSEITVGALENPLMAPTSEGLSGAPPFPNLLGQWAGIITEAVSNIGQLGQLIASDPAPILQQIIQNQLGYGRLYLTALKTVGKNAITYLDPGTPWGLTASFQRVVQQVAAGNITGAVGAIQNALTMGLVQLGLPMMSTLNIPVRMAQNFANVVALLPGFASTMGFSALALVNTTLASIGQSGQAIADAVKARNPGAVLGAVLSTPGNVVETFVNGWSGFGGGLIGPNGILTKLLKFRDTIAAALGAGGASGAAAKPAEEPSRAENAKVDAGTPADSNNGAPASAAASKRDKSTDSMPGIAPAHSGEPASTNSEPTATTDGSAATESAAAQPAKADATAETKPRAITTPGHAINTAERAAAKAISTAGKQITSATNKFGEDLKKTFTKPRKPTKTDTPTKPAKSDSDGSGSNKDHKASSGAAK